MKEQFSWNEVNEWNNTSITARELLMTAERGVVRRERDEHAASLHE